MPAEAGAVPSLRHKMAPETIYVSAVQPEFHPYMGEGNWKKGLGGSLFLTLCFTDHLLSHHLAHWHWPSQCSSLCNRDPAFNYLLHVSCLWFYGQVRLSPSIWSLFRNVYECLACMYVCNIYMSDTCGTGPLELDLGMVVSHHVNARSRTRVLCENQCS